MSNYSISPRAYSPVPSEKYNKFVTRYLKSYQYHERIEAFYRREVERHRRGAPLPYSWEEFVKSFKAKNFWKNYHDCGSYILADYYFTSKKLKVQDANFCRRDKICPACAVRRAYKQQLKFLQIVSAKPEFLAKDWYYIVLTVKHTADESFETVFNRVVNLKKKITKAMRNGRMRGDRNIWTKFGGGMYSIETTYGSNGWHVHLNLLVNADAGTHINISEVTNSRGQVSRQNDEIRQFLEFNAGSRMHDVQKLDFTNQESLMAALVEVLKYSLKFSSLSIQQIVEFYVKTNRKRLFGTFGNLWGLGLDEVDLEGDEKLDGPFVELLIKRVMLGDMPDYRIDRITPHILKDCKSD